ncbi:hypothetical protein ACTGYF_10810, partial [Streptococcus suis]
IGKHQGNIALKPSTFQRGHKRSFGGAKPRLRTAASSLTELGRWRVHMFDPKESFNPCRE